MIEYRDALPPAAAFKNLYDSTGWGSPDRGEDFYAAALAGSWACCAAWEDDQLIGFARLISDGCLHAYVNEMIVLPQAQGRGVGAEILRRLLAVCAAADIRDIQLFAARGKAGFYAAQGFASRPIDAPGMQYQPTP